MVIFILGRGRGGGRGVVKGSQWLDNQLFEKLNKLEVLTFLIIW